MAKPWVPSRRDDHLNDPKKLGPRRSVGRSEALIRLDAFCLAAYLVLGEFSDGLGGDAHRQGPRRNHLAFRQHRPGSEP